MTNVLYVKGEKFDRNLLSSFSVVCTKAFFHFYGIDDFNLIHELVYILTKHNIKQEHEWKKYYQLGTRTKRSLQGSKRLASFGFIAKHVYKNVINQKILQKLSKKCGYCQKSFGEMFWLEESFW